MRLLKKKIQASLDAQKRTSERVTRDKHLYQKHVTKAKTKDIAEQPIKRKRMKGRAFTPKIYLQTKNIVTNFGKAIASFAISELAVPYLEKIFYGLRKEGEEVQLANFVEFVNSARGSISSIDNLRALVLEEENDDQMSILHKRVFRLIGEVFIKYFSVNWIIHGRVTYKMIHLKFRYKMLRRIQNPSCFTYLKGYNQDKKSTV